MTNPAWLDSPFMRACRQEPAPYTPIWLMRQAGRFDPAYRAIRSKVSFLELCRNADLVAEVTVGAVERLGVDAAIIFADLLLPLEPLGFEVRFAAGEMPKIDPPVRDMTDLKRLPEFDHHALDYVYNGLRTTRAALPDTIPLIGFAGAPFTLASYCIEGGSSRSFTATKTLMYTQPDVWNGLLSRLVEALIPYVAAQVEAGAGAIQIFDSWVGCLSPADYRRYVLPHTKSLFDGLPAGIPILHFGTDTATLLEAMAEAGGTVMGIDWRVPLTQARTRLPGKAIMGNLDPSVLFADQDTIVQQVKRVLEEAGDGPGHIFNLGHGILPPTPPENVKFLVETVKRLSARP